MKDFVVKKNQLLEELVAIVRRSGEIVRQQWQEERHVRHKGRVDLVTQTDLAVESFLKEQLAALVPGVGFLRRKAATRLPGRPGDCWIIDPWTAQPTLCTAFRRWARP